MAKESMPFELKRPDANTPVTNATEIDFGNTPLDQSITGRDAKVNGNSTNIENKVNAIISCLEVLIQHVAFHSGVPYGIPQQLQSELSLLRVGDNIASDTSLCGNAICGNAICGNN